MTRFWIVLLGCLALASCSGRPAIAPSPAPRETIGTTSREEPTVASAERAWPTARIATAVKPTPNVQDVGTTVIVLNAMRKVNLLHSYRARQTIVSNGATVTRTIEALPPDRMHMITKGKGIANESFVISTTVYSRLGTGPWQQFAAASLGSSATPLDAGAEGQGAGSAVFTPAGEETLDGVETRVYRSETELPGGAGRSVQTVWVGKEDGLVHKAQSSVVVGAGAARIQTDSTVTYYDFDAPDVVIEPPNVP